jgi:predicted mannosyl-3-phosphoglycerate phosphatase (HAD superfamily)
VSGETEANISGWTVDTLHSHVLAMLREKDLRDAQRFEARQLALRDALVGQEKAVNAALQAAQQAVQKAETAAKSDSTRSTNSAPSSLTRQRLSCRAPRRR